MSERPAKERLELAGAAIAPGLVLGRAYMLRQISLEALEMRPLPVSDTASEIERLGRAVDQTLAQLRQLQAKVDPSNRRDVADIFETQLSLLEDVAFLERIREAVRAQAVNTEHLIAIEVRRLEATFDAMKDDVLRSRFLDIQDVYHRLLRNLLEIEHVRTNPFQKLTSPIVLVADRMLPSDVALLELAKVLGIVIEEGSRVSHVAIIAKSLGIPALTDVAHATGLIRSGDTVLLDADAGRLIVRPNESDLAWYEKARQRRSSSAALVDERRRREPAVRDHRRCLRGVGGERRFGARGRGSSLACGAEGIGLLRSEFFYMSCRPDADRGRGGALLSRRARRDARTSGDHTPARPGRRQEPAVSPLAAGGESAAGSPRRAGAASHAGAVPTPRVERPPGQQRRTGSRSPAVRVHVDRPRARPGRDRGSRAAGNASPATASRSA